MITLSLESLSTTALSRPDGYLDDILSHAKVDGDAVVLSDESYRLLIRKYRFPQAGNSGQVTRSKTQSDGPGAELSKLLKRFGIEPTPTCACRAKAAQMDAWGPDECSKPERIEEVVGVMREEAKARGLPFLDAAARLLVRRAIANARKAEAKRAREAEGSPLHPER